MAINIDLLEVNARIAEVGQLLEQWPNQGGVYGAVSQLRSVDALLAKLVVEDGLPTGVAARIGRVRDDLSSHLEAALAVDVVAVNDDASAVLLRRGVTAAHTELESVANEHLTNPHASEPAHGAGHGTTVSPPIPDLA